MKLVGRERLETFREKMEKASEVLQSIPLDKAPVQTYQDLALVAQALSWEEKEIAEAVDRLLKSPYATNAGFHHTIAANRLARWNGFDGHSRAYALEMKKRIGGAQALEVFLSIAGHLHRYFPYDKYFERTEFTRDELMAAAALEESTPEPDPLAATTLLRLTWASADGEHAAEQFERFRRAGSPYLQAFWKTVTPYEQAYVWCREAGKIASQENDPAAAKREEQDANPSKDQPRFVDRGDYVEDTQTGLLWQKDGDVSKELNYYQAVRYAERLRLGGLRNWRLPTPEEIRAIYPATEPPFVDTQKSQNYWTSASVSPGNYARVVQLGVAKSAAAKKKSGLAANTKSNIMQNRNACGLSIYTEISECKQNWIRITNAASIYSQGKNKSSET